MLPEDAEEAQESDDPGEDLADFNNTNATLSSENYVQSQGENIAEPTGVVMD